MNKKIKEIHGERPSNLTDEDYQAILDAEEGIFYLTKPEMSEVEKLQAAQRITRDETLTPKIKLITSDYTPMSQIWATEQFRRLN